MTKKDFKTYIDFHRYTSRQKEGNINAIFYDWQDGEGFRGFKYCIYARAVNATKLELTNILYDFIQGKIEDVEWYVQLVVAFKDEQRFKVPIMGSGLNCLIKGELLK